MAKTKDVVATTENAPILSDEIRALVALPQEASDLIIKSRQHKVEGDKLELDLMDWFIANDVPNTHLISPNKTNANSKSKRYLLSTCTPEFYSDMVWKVQLGEFGEFKAKCLQLASAEQVRFHPDYANHEHGGDFWADWFKMNNTVAGGIISDYQAKLLKKEEAEATKKAMKAELELAKKEGRKPNLEQFSTKKGADENKTKTIGQKFQAHLENALKSLTTWRNMDNVPEEILSSHEQYAKDIKAMMAKAKKAEEVRH